jgi:hypothetical protein
MTNEVICFEKAAPADLQAIWHLLHADGKMMKEKQIIDILNDLYVLRYHQRILGALCGTYYAGKVNIAWVVIHPLFPEKDLREAMSRQFSGVICREPEDNSQKTAIFKQWFQWCKALFRNDPLFIGTEGVINGVQDQ